MKKLLQKLPNRYMVMATVSLFTMIPVAASAFQYAKGADPGDNWWYVTGPGVGMAIAGNFGNSMALAALLGASCRLHWLVRCFLLAWSAGCFGSAFFVLSSYLEMSAAGVEVAKITEVLGPDWTSWWFRGFFLMGEGPVVPLLALAHDASAQEAEAATEKAAATATKQAAKATAAQQVLLDEIRGEVTAGAARAVQALMQRDGQTAADLARALGVGVSSVGGYMRKLEAAGYVEGREDFKTKTRHWYLKERPLPGAPR